MASVDDIVGQFQLFNIEPSGEVVSKCLELCSKHNVDAEELVDQWFAYTSSVLRGAAPTVEYLEKMERKEFLKSKDQVLLKTITDIEEQSPLISSTPYQPPSLDSDILDPPKENHAPISNIQKTPGKNKNLLDTTMASTSSSPGTSSVSYSSRTDSRSVRFYYGPKDAQFKKQYNDHLTVKPLCEDSLKSNERFMFEILSKRGRALNNITEHVLKAISSKNQLEDAINKDESDIFCGRVVSDSDGKINNQSVLLELTQRNKGSTLCLNFSKILKLSLFPGQTIAVKGSYDKTSGRFKDKIFVEAIYFDTTLNLLPEPPVIRDSLQLIIASGPFTTEDNLLFEPLNDLLLYARDCKPNVLLLMGPFYERNHPGIMNGELKQDIETFFFDLLENIMKTLVHTDIHVIIVSSQREAHQYPVYPTPPYEIRDKYENLTFMPDPAMVNVNGLIIGATTADILFDISNFEMYMDKTNSGPPDRMARLASHLLKQQSFYPLNPPHKDICLDMSLMETHGIMDVKPHILVLPSNLRHFVKEIEGCVVVNPERLTKGSGGGTFARLEVRSGLTPFVCGRSACQILKI